MQSLVMILLSMAGFTGCQQSIKPTWRSYYSGCQCQLSREGTGSQDFMDVEYVPLETNDEFITQGIVEAIGKKVIVVRNMRDGNIFVYDRATGKGIKKINRFGQGAEEYSGINSIILDEDNSEMFVSDYPARKISVYDLSGNYKRSFKYADTGYYDDIFNFDRDHLICYKKYSTPKEDEQACHLLVSSKTEVSPVKSESLIKRIRHRSLWKMNWRLCLSFTLMFPNQNNWMTCEHLVRYVVQLFGWWHMYPIIAGSLHQYHGNGSLSFPDRYYRSFIILCGLWRKELDYKTFKEIPWYRFVLWQTGKDSFSVYHVQWWLFK